MAKIFSEQAELNNHPSRNNFDLSHKVHMTGKMGLLYPVLCKPVVPGDTFRINSGCAFNFMPMPYPTQTRMRFIQHFFYVRNKNIWKNWQNWLQGLEEHVPPYIDQPVSFFKTGSLADFLDIPTTVKVLNPVVPLYGDNLTGVQQGNVSSWLYGLSASNAEKSNTVAYERHSRNEDLFGPVRDDPSELPKLSFARLYTAYVDACAYSVSPLSANNANGWTQPSSGYINGLTRACLIPKGPVRRNSDGSVSFSLPNPLMFNAGNHNYYEVGLWMSPDGPVRDRNMYLLFKTRSNYNDAAGTFRKEFIFTRLQADCLEKYREEYPGAYFYLTVTGYFGSGNVSWVECSSEMSVGDWPTDLSQAVNLEDHTEANPYYSDSNSGSDTVRVSALPFRAYESIYNAFYRNQHGNQPFMIDGVPQYNRYITTDEDGADTTDYRLFRRNWELDAYTSCLPSPQQGPAPVVGMTALGKVTIVDPETGVTTTAQATDTNNGLQFTDVNIGEASHQQYLVNLASSGLTINDFRNVNALQRFLETNIRKGFRYVDFIEGHFGQRIKDATMDMPEFIGGFSEIVSVNMISNTTSQKVDDVEQLGSYGGQASAFGGTKHTISHYCDDYGFIVGILCLVPEPTYSQILPKHFNIKQPLDFYFPEFAQIGLQPITYEEFCPVQSKMESRFDSNKKLTDVFGYQRPNHDMVWFPDTLHGEFRLSFSDFIVNRMFDHRPELGNEFLTIKPEETNSIFNYTAPDSDVFVGQLAFDIKAKRPVPRIVIPSLGR